MQVYQPKDRMDVEIEELRLLMVKMSLRRNEERINISISRASRQNNGKIHMTEEDCRSKASGALQQKIWKLGELNMTRTNLHDKMYDRLQNFFWDPGILNIEYYDQEIIFISS